MFRLIRTAIFVMLAFFAGVMFERSNARTLCDAATGDWVGGLCLTGEGTHD